MAKITVGEEYDEEQDEAFVDPEQINLVRPNEIAKELKAQQSAKSYIGSKSFHQISIPR